MPPITLITDFGTKDHYVGAMKGVILRMAPEATIVDITHDINSHDVVHGAFVLRETVSWFPPGTIHVAVVDPGVGSGRAILAGRYGGQTIIAPDNGLISLVHRKLPLEAMHIVKASHLFLPSPSPTFHGRDVMAPVAAHLATGTRIEEVGPTTNEMEMLRLPRLENRGREGLVGRVLYVDHFGSLVTNIGRGDLADVYRHNVDVQVFVGDTRVGPIEQTYCDVPAGQPLALIGSTNMLEIAVNRGRAADRFAHDDDTPIIVK